MTATVENPTLNTEDIKSEEKEEEGSYWLLLPLLYLLNAIVPIDRHASSLSE